MNPNLVGAGLCLLLLVCVFAAMFFLRNESGKFIRVEWALLWVVALIALSGVVYGVASFIH